MMKAEDLDACRPGTGHADVAWAMREAMHRILYTVVHSNAMNGVSADLVIEVVTPWWQTAVLAAQIATGALCLAFLAWTVLRVRKESAKKGKG